MNGNSSNKNQPQQPNQSMSMEELGKQTWEALNKLNAPNTSFEDRNIADNFLKKYLPKHPLCWTVFAKFLTTTDNVPHEAHFFAANMLKRKILYNLHEVPREQHQSLHDMILNVLINFNRKGEQYNNVRTQLSVALSLIAIQRTDWTNEVQNIVDKLSNKETLDILLSILTCLPEELCKFNVPVSHIVERKAKQNLRSHAPVVLKILAELFRMVEDNNFENKNAIELKVICFVI